MANRYCPQCGSEVPENSKFCFSCGADLNNFGYNPAPAPQFDEDAEPVVVLKSRSIAPYIVSAAIMYTVVIPLIFFPFYVPGSYSIGFYEFWLWFSIMFAIVMGSVLEPLSVIFGIIRTTRLNRLSGKMITYVPSRNAFVFPTINGPMEIYARNIVSFVGPAAVLVTFYEESGPRRILSGWCIREDIYILRDKLTEVLQTSVI